MLTKVGTLVGIVATSVVALLAYTNMAYFPMAEGSELKVKMAGIEKNINDKLDVLIARSEKGG